MAGDRLFRRRPVSGKRQLSLFDPVEHAAPGAPAAPHALLATVDDRVAEARRQFHRAVSQATEKLILSYPRADPRSGRERLPSLFFVSAAAALQGRPLSGAELGRLVSADTLVDTAVEDALDSHPTADAGVNATTGQVGDAVLASLDRQLAVAAQ